MMQGSLDANDRRVWLIWGAESDDFEVAADGAAPLRADIDAANRAVAARIVDDLFYETTPGRKTAPVRGQIVTLDAPIVQAAP